MSLDLDFTGLRKLLDSVFQLESQEKDLSILVDLPGGSASDNDKWRERRGIALEWYRLLDVNSTAIPFKAVNLCCYDNVGSNNNDLPEECKLVGGLSGDLLPDNGTRMPFSQLFERSSVVMALTEFSATAPLKNAARAIGFRGASMPGFSRVMMPTLGIDYEQVDKRVMEFKRRMDDAEGVTVVLSVHGREFRSYYDLRFRLAHASGGLMRQPGVVGNLPSGEAYIVPYEGEKTGEPSKTQGELAVQFGDEVVVYDLKDNRAGKVLTDGMRSDEERQKLAEEPAYGNIAEVGIGVLGEWGVTAVGSTLVDEKLGLHIAFGRSEHFGGVTGPEAFKDPKKVIHIDRVYVPSTQPLIRVEEVRFHYAGLNDEIIIKSGKYLV
jgi:hypothetical protein